MLMLMLLLLLNRNVDLGDGWRRLLALWLLQIAIGSSSSLLLDHGRSLRKADSGAPTAIGSRLRRWSKVVGRCLLLRLIDWGRCYHCLKLLLLRTVLAVVHHSSLFLLLLNGRRVLRKDACMLLPRRKLLTLPSVGRGWRLLRLLE